MLFRSQDKVKAVYWFTKAAEQGDAEAQYNLGVMYNKGEGIAQDKLVLYIGIQKQQNKDYLKPNII